MTATMDHRPLYLQAATNRYAFVAEPSAPTIRVNAIARLPASARPRTSATTKNTPTVCGRPRGSESDRFKKSGPFDNNIPPRAKARRPAYRAKRLRDRQSAACFRLRSRAWGIEVGRAAPAKKLRERRYPGQSPRGREVGVVTGQQLAARRPQLGSLLPTWSPRKSPKP